MLKNKIPLKNIILNPAQALFYVALKVGKKYIYLKMGRGAGKSTMLALAIISCVQQMPRSTGVLVGETYQQILSKTFQSTKEGLEMFGWIEGIHYVVGKHGYDLGFRKSFQSPNDWRRAIHFRNGAIMIMVSLGEANAGRGINSYWVIGDEAALFDAQRLFDNVQTTNRSIKTEFKNAPLLNAEIFATSVPMTKKGKWVNDAEAECLLPKNIQTHAYLKANAFVNKANLTEEWFQRMKDKAISEMHYNAEIGNIDPPNVLNAFYNFFNEAKHTYGHKHNTDYLLDVGFGYTNEHDNCRQDGDLTRGVPLHLSIDPGKIINSMIVWQYLKSINEERSLKEFFVKDPQDYEDMITQFDDYYDYHKQSNNTIYLRHDAQAFKERDKTDKVLISEKIEKKLRELGWKVINMTPKTNNPRHMSKSVVMNTILKEREPNLPKWRINRDNCPNLIISITKAETEIKGDSDFGKDKSSERDSKTLPEHATHLSDAADYHLYWKWHDTVSGLTSSFGS